MTTDILELPVPYRDASARDLGLFLDLPAQPALVTRRVDLGRWSVELRILGASHQVLVTSDGVTVCSETVACHLVPTPTSAALPSRQRRRTPDADHTFEARIHRLELDALRLRVGELADGLAGTPSVCARFPGDELATTGLRLTVTGRDDELTWSGWHSYPKTSEVVTTSSHLVVHQDRSRSTPVTAP
jgi:hypothetical protein